MQDYTSNSNRDKDKTPVERPVIEKLIGADVEVIVKRKGIGHRIRTLFFNGDLSNAARYVAIEVLVPAARNLMVDATNKGISRVVYGENAPRSTMNRNDLFGRIQYHSPVNRIPASLPRGVSPGSPSHRSSGNPNQQEAQDIIIADHASACAVLEQMDDVCDKYGYVSLVELQTILGLASTHIDNKWGWTNLSTARVVQVRQGYLLDLPPLEEVEG